MVVCILSFLGLVRQLTLTAVSGSQGSKRKSGRTLFICNCFPTVRLQVRLDPYASGPGKLLLLLVCSMTTQEVVNVIV